MPTLFHPKTNKNIHDFDQIKNILNKYHVEIAKWTTDKIVTNESTQEEILAAYSHELKPFMERHGYQTADVINVHDKTPNINELRQKFLKEHTHAENEVRFFIDGAGLFWFHFDDGEVYSIKCTAGDFISVPKNYKHWFDLHPEYHVKAIRIFTNPEGWVAQYTNSFIEEKYISI